MQNVEMTTTQAGDNDEHLEMALQVKVFAAAVLQEEDFSSMQADQLKLVWTSMQMMKRKIECCMRPGQTHTCKREAACGCDGSNRI